MLSPGDVKKPFYLVNIPRTEKTRYFSVENFVLASCHSVETDAYGIVIFLKALR